MLSTTRLRIGFTIGNAPSPFVGHRAAPFSGLLFTPTGGFHGFAVQSPASRGFSNQHAPPPKLDPPL